MNRLVGSGSHFKAFRIERKRILHRANSETPRNLSSTEMHVKTIMGKLRNEKLVTKNFN
jgi:hypothetical protein